MTVTGDTKVTADKRRYFSAVTFVCPVCEAATSIQIETAEMPLSCRSCGSPVSNEAHSALSVLARFHREATTAEAKAGKSLFRIEVNGAGNA